MAVPHGQEEFLKVLSVELSVEEWSCHPGRLDTSLQRTQSKRKDRKIDHVKSCLNHKTLNCK